VLFVLELQSRAVHIASVVHQPDGAWMMQVGRNLTDCGGYFLRPADCRRARSS